MIQSASGCRQPEESQKRANILELHCTQPAPPPRLTNVLNEISIETYQNFRYNDQLLIIRVILQTKINNQSYSRQAVACEALLYKTANHD